MQTLPTTMIQVLAPFVSLFSKRVWRHAQVLLAGAILAPGTRTVTAALRAMGLAQSKQFHRYHRILNRAVWSGREAGRVLLGLLVGTFVPDGEPLVIGVDETLERRWGAKIAAKGDLPGSSALEPRAFRQGQRPAVAVLDAPRADPVGREGLGPTLPQRARPLRALRRRAGQEAAQEAHRLGSAVALVGQALVARARGRGRGRLRLRGDRAAGPLGTPFEAYRHGNPPAPGRRPLRTGPATPGRPDRTAPPT